MTLNQLKKSIQACFVGATFVVDGFDVVLDAIDTARIEAQQRIDFELGYQLVKANVTSSGLDLGDFMMLSGDPVDGTINTLRNAWRVLNGHMCPIDLVTAGTIESRQRDYAGSMPRYPSDADVGLWCSGYSQAVFRRGNLVYYHPFGSVSLVLDANVWVPSVSTYGGDVDNPDFLFQYCSNFLKWAAIVELNPLYKEFVPRQEGNVTPQDQAKANAFDAMERWNAGIESQVSVQR